MKVERMLKDGEQTWHDYPIEKLVEKFMNAGDSELLANLIIQDMVETGRIYKTCFASYRIKRS